MLYNYNSFHLMNHKLLFIMQYRFHLSLALSLSLKIHYVFFNEQRECGYPGLCGKTSEERHAWSNKQQTYEGIWHHPTEGKVNIRLFVLLSTCVKLHWVFIFKNSELQLQIYRILWSHLIWNLTEEVFWHQYFVETLWPP